MMDVGYWNYRYLLFFVVQLGYYILINKAKWLSGITKLDKIDAKWQSCRQA